MSAVVSPSHVFLSFLPYRSTQVARAKARTSAQDPTPRRPAFVLPIDQEQMGATESVAGVFLDL